MEVLYYFREEYLCRSFRSAFSLQRTPANTGSIQKAYSFQASTSPTLIPRLPRYRIALTSERADG